MNPKIEKMEREMEKLRDKIAESQARLRELEKQKTEMENSEIVAVFRTHNIGPNELAEFIRQHREQNGAAPAIPTERKYHEKENQDNED